MTDEKLEGLAKHTLIMQNLFSNVKNTEKELEEELTEMNNAQNDLLHYLEFENLNASDMAKIASALRNVRRRRRKIKNMWMTFQAMDKENNMKKGAALDAIGQTWMPKPYRARTSIIKDTVGNPNESFMWSVGKISSKKK